MLIDGRAAARSDLEQLAGTLGDRHPAIVAARARLRDYDKNIGQSLAGLRRTARAQLAEAQDQKTLLSRRLGDLAAEMTRMRAAESDLRELEDSVDTQRKSLASLDNRQRDASDMSRAETANIRIVSPARAANAQGRVLAMALWSLFGGLIGAMLAVTALALAAPFAPPPIPDAEWPQLPAFDPGASDGFDQIDAHPASPYSQTVRTLCREIWSQGAGKAEKPLTLLVVAAEPRCGASTLAANLARAAAADGRRTLLIDANAARPALARMISADAPKTLIQLDGGWRPLYRLEPLSAPLSLVPTLADETQVCASIGQNGEYEALNGVEGHFDFIVIDGPDLSAEAQHFALSALARRADRVLLVAPAGKALLAKLKFSKDKFVGMVAAPLVKQRKRIFKVA